MGGLHLCGCKDSENFWNAQILDRELFEKVIFEMETQKNSQFVAASWGKPGVFTDTTIGRGLSGTGLLPKGFFVPIYREAHSTYYVCLA
jgi:hypothetical protein